MGARVTRATAIPAEARGLDDVQNHPLHRAEGEWAYDAINEVCFDGEAGLRTCPPVLREPRGHRRGRPGRGPVVPLGVRGGAA